MPVLRLAALAVCIGVLQSCTTGPVDTPPPPPAPSPLLTFDTRIRADTVTLTSAVAAHGETITAHRILLNGVVVRSGPALSLTVQDTVLPGGTYSFSAEATTAGGTAHREFAFLVREALPPTARSLTFEGEEAAPISVNMTNVTSGALDRQYTFAPPPTVVFERTGTSTIRVRAAAAGSIPADDVYGTFLVPYSVADRNGSASGVLQFNFRPQPDITITAIRFLTGEPVSESVRIILNGKVHDFAAGSRIQARTGENTWELWEEFPSTGGGGQGGLVGVLVEGQGGEIPLNRLLTSDTMSLGPTDVGAELMVLGATYPGFDAACRSTFESIYTFVRADTVQMMNFIVLTQPAPGREAIAVGSASFLRWREAFDSLVAEEGRRATQMNRAPRTFTFTTDLETEPRRVFVHHNLAFGQPATGQVWLYDSLPPSVGDGIAAGGRRSTSLAGDVLSGSAWSTPVGPVPNRRMALTTWFDGANGMPENPACSRHRTVYGPEVANTEPHPIEAALVPLLQARANWILLNRGIGTMIIR